jgi:hypothetical protein
LTNTKIAKNFGYFFPLKKIHISFVAPHFSGDFLTNSSGHPDDDVGWLYGKKYA